ncbi:Glucose transporter type 1, partial [Gryllus bimaculatus]
VWMLYVARLLIGTAGGINIVVISMYLEEISEVKVRGTIGSYFELSASFGMLLSYILGAILPYFWYTVVGVVPAVSMLLVFSWVPESPVFL